MKFRHFFASSNSGKKTDIWMALVFLGLIIVPSGLLGYFSWRALQNEKLLSRERLVRSYNRFARLAALQIDKELDKIEKRWLRALEKITKENQDEYTVEVLNRLVQKEALITEYYYFSAPGKLIYPQEMRLSGDVSSREMQEKNTYLENYEFFEKYTEKGENLEYYDSDLAGALTVYRRVFRTVRDRQLQGVTKSYIGRVLMKQGNWDDALRQLRELLRDYSDVRDLNGMLLSLWAEYQIVICLESLGSDQEAIEALLQLNRNLLEQSDAINTVQYSNFIDEINSQLPRLFSSPLLKRKAFYKREFAALAKTNKKQISQRFFVAFFNRKLNEGIIGHKKPRNYFKYYSGEAANEPYLLGSIFLADGGRPQIRGLIGIHANLMELRQKLFPAIIKNLNFGKDAQLAIVNNRNEIVIGEAPAQSRMIAVKKIARPFDFWQVAIFLEEGEKLLPENSIKTTIGLWLISLLLLSILLGAYIFIRRAQREAHLSQMKSTFVSSLSHELRTPLASIKMLAELLEMQFAKASDVSVEKLKQRGGEYLGVIHRESERLGRLIDNLLDISRIERGDKKYYFEYEEIAAIIMMAVESIRPQIEAEGFLLMMEVADDLPEVRIDADAISQVILNLVSNAMKYSDSERKISIRAYAQNRCVHVEVADKGVGIAPSEQQKVFDRFYRVDQKLNTTKQGGVGIGLTLVRQIVTDHGGKVHVESEPGKGATFTFTLPVPDDTIQGGNADPPSVTLESESQQTTKIVEKEL
jgi:signal transduction histidine kinase/predicted negative regulator of RcsB-dependent stress response